MEWNDETQAHTGNVEVIPFTYEQIVEIKDLTYTSLIKVQEKLLDLFPRLPKHDYKTLVDNYYLSANIKAIMDESEMAKAMDVNNVLLMSGLMLNQLVDFEWRNFRIDNEVKRGILHASIFEYPLEEDVVHSLIENVIHIDNWDVDVYRQMDGYDVDEDA